PSVKPHRFPASAGQFGCGVTFSSADGSGIAELMVVCEYEFGMYDSVIVSSRKTVAGSGLTRPMRRGRTDAKKFTSEPVTGPWYGPAPAMTSSLKSIS